MGTPTSDGSSARLVACGVFATSGSDGTFFAVGTVDRVDGVEVDELGADELVTVMVVDGVAMVTVVGGVTTTVDAVPTVTVAGEDGASGVVAIVSGEAGASGTSRVARVTGLSSWEATLGSSLS